jgi:hypothetical protein
MVPLTGLSGFWRILGEMLLRAFGEHDEDQIEKWSGQIGAVLFLSFLLLIAIVANAFRE